MAKALSNNQKKEIALDLYLHTDLTQKEICDRIGWTEQTFSKHKQKDNWDILKGATTVTAEKLVARLYRHLDEITTPPPPRSRRKDDDEEEDEFFKWRMPSADELNKIASAIEKLETKRVTISHHINSFKEFTTWLSGKDVELTKVINKLQDEFIKQKIHAS